MLRARAATRSSAVQRADRLRLLSKRNITVLALLAALGLLAFWLLSAPRGLTLADLPQHQPNIANGEILYHAAGCWSCHKPGSDLKDVDPNLPAGGFALKTPVGTFYPPNLTPDPETGVGTWSDLDFVNAVQRGVSPAGENLIPAFPYTSYAHMKVEDVLDIKAYLATLPAVDSPARAAEIPFPPLLRRGVGLWKWIGLDTTPWTPDPAQSASWNRGSYLVNGPGHCAECHTPRNVFMALDFRTGPGRRPAPRRRRARAIAARPDRTRAATRTRRTLPRPCSSARCWDTTGCPQAGWRRFSATSRNCPTPTFRRSASISPASSKLRVRQPVRDGGSRLLGILERGGSVRTRRVRHSVPRATAADIRSPSAAGENWSCLPHSIRAGHSISESRGHRSIRPASASDWRAMTSGPWVRAMAMKASRVARPLGPGRWEMMAAISATTASASPREAVTSGGGRQPDRPQDPAPIDNNEARDALRRCKRQLEGKAAAEGCSHDHKALRRTRQHLRHTTRETVGIRDLDRHPDGPRQQVPDRRVEARIAAKGRNGNQRRHAKCHSMRWR